MAALSNLFKVFTQRPTLRRPQVALSYLNVRLRRNYADTPKQDVNSKQIVVQGTENDQRLRVRRARPADVPRVLRFVREHAKTAWPGLINPPSASHMVLCDYVARALSQGHSMLAEQQESRRGWSQIRGLALGMSVCPWDAMMLEKWARCVKCTRSRRLMHFTAHCLRAPGLHDKYNVHNILQVILIVPPDSVKNNEIVQILVKNAIRRGREVGFPVLRFDVTDDTIAKALEELNLKREWQLTYDVLPEVSREIRTGEAKTTAEAIKEYDPNLLEAHFIAVYTAVAGKQQADTTVNQ